MIILFATSIQHYAALNGAKFGPSYPYRGLRRGILYHLYMFILYLEELSTLFHRAESVEIVTYPKFLDMLLAFLTCFLLTIVSSFLEEIMQNAQ